MLVDVPSCIYFVLGGAGERRGRRGERARAFVGLGAAQVG